MNGTIPPWTATDGDGLFSVDADAHLQKLAACMFPSPAQLPTELVREALRRGAKRVEVEVKRRLVVVADNGNEIDAASWDNLVGALEALRLPPERERAIAALQEAAAPGIGLLAVLLPDAREILIASPGPAGRPPLRFRGNRRLPTDPAGAAAGTRIVINRRARAKAAGLEKKLISELCAGAGAEIVLNGRPLEKRPRLRRVLVRLGLALPQGRAEVGIPASGDICRVWLLDQEIPWQLFTSSSCAGLVFEAACESRRPVAAADLAALAEAAARLYDWLAERHGGLPQRLQDRVEELLFRRMQVSGDNRHASAFAPFRVCGSTRRLSLEEVRLRAAGGAVLAVSGDGRPGSLPFGREALCLSPRQRDFLLNHAGVALETPPADAPDGGFLERCLAVLAIGRDRAAALLAPRKPLDEAEWTPGEIGLCRALQALAPSGVRVGMASGRWPGPAAWRSGSGSGWLLLRRRHRVVRAAAAWVARDSANAETAFLALAPLALLTVSVR